MYKRQDISDQAEMCPHCGCSINSNKNSVGTNNSTDGFCLGGMITGICSFFIDFFGLVSLTGLVISIIGLTRAQGKNKTFAVLPYRRLVALRIIPVSYTHLGP